MKIIDERTMQKKEPIKKSKQTNNLRRIKSVARAKAIMKAWEINDFAVHLI